MTDPAPDKVNVGVIGCGSISDRYFEGCRSFPLLEVLRCADLDLARAAAKARQHGIPRHGTVDELLADPEIELVVNLTVPKAHAAIDLAGHLPVTVLMSFDVWHHHLPQIEIYGTEGTLRTADPNAVAGDVWLRRQDHREWRNIAPTGAPVPHRGAGVADLARAIRDRRPARTTGALAQHVVDAMAAFAESAAAGRHITLTTTCARPAAFAAGVMPGSAGT